MKWLLVAIASLVGALAFAFTASAHVLITDTTNTRGAIVHIIPDDDPVAGEPATIFFDTQNQLLTNESTVTLLVENTATNTSNQLQANVTGSLAVIEYTFPTQGVYQLTFTVQTGDSTYTFELSQRISRGISTSALNTPRHEWAEILFIAASVALVVLAIIAFNHRREVARQSTF